MIDDINRRVRDCVLRHALIAPGDTVIVAVSGGADSLCLLHVLCALASELDCRLHVAHLDHVMRDASPDDAAFVAAHAAELGLPCTLDRIDVADLSRKRRLSLETAARIARYEFLRAVAATVHASTIATGHTRDDQAETVLLHLLRGSGLSGLAGMRPVRDGLIRPLLDITRAETVAYCRVMNLAPREDESNASSTHRRNRVRHEIVPLLDAMQPAASANIERAARLLASDLALLERLAELALDHAVSATGDGAAKISAARWAEAEAELQPHMLRLLLLRLQGHADGFDERHYNAMLAALQPRRVDSCISLPHGLVLARYGDEAVLGWPRAETHEGGWDVSLAVPGEVVTPGGIVRAQLAVAPPDWNGVSATEAYLDAGSAGRVLRVRTWRSGDRVRPLGMTGTRKMQDVFVDRKVPRDRRHQIPLVVGPHDIAWVAGLVVAEPYRARPNAPAVHLTWEQ